MDTNPIYKTQCLFYDALLYCTVLYEVNKLTDVTRGLIHSLRRHSVIVKVTSVCELCCPDTPFAFVLFLACELHESKLYVKIGDGI